MAFGSMAALPPGLTGGLTLTPTPIIALLLIVRTLASERGINFTLTSALMPDRLALLFAFWLVAVIVTIFMPRVFAGHVDVIPVRGILTGTSRLYPTAQNISQLAYLTISIFSVFTFARLYQSAYYRWHMMRAMYLGGIVVVVTGLLDFATQFLPIRPLLEPFRTATYALLTDVEVLGGKRVIGLMPEASSFGNLCLNFLGCLYFFRLAFDDGKLRNRHVPIVLALLLFLLWQATSSSAYVGLALLALCAALHWCLRALSAPRSEISRTILLIEFWAVFAGLVSVVAVIVFSPALLDPIMATLDRMVFQKTSSHSYEERGMWTAVSWQALLDTYGLGVGLGGTRPSNAFVGVVSSTGFVGGVLYYGFVAYTMVQKAPAHDETRRVLMQGARWSYLPVFVVGLLAGTGADFGAFDASRFGLLISAVIASAVNLHPASTPFNRYRA
jgi:hypothetical protein